MQCSRHLTTNGRAVRTDRTPLPLWVAGENRALYAHLEEETATATILRRYVEHHGPVTVTELAQRYGLTEDRIRQTTARWQEDRSMVHGRFRPATTSGTPGAGMVLQTEPRKHPPQIDHPSPEGDPAIDAC